ncbi:hypothetical protein [Paracoccus everestensis]|uniref:hypothetical protein n=1 Tax=Paracoccus everestensis TaxID=2903900 RepID=UPI001F1B3F59|nr:hypothetical protein [Paracoccus everestensis]
MTFGVQVLRGRLRARCCAGEPLAIEAAFEAERIHRERQEDRRQILDLELQQACCEAALAERCYAACDPDNRLIAARLEKNWETALRRVRDLEARQFGKHSSTIEIDPRTFANLADNLSAAWNAPDVTMGRLFLLVLFRGWLLRVYRSHCPQRHLWRAVAAVGSSSAGSARTVSEFDQPPSSPGA